MNDQFKRALQIMEKTGEHAFITGKAGTGKSTLLSYFIKHTEKSLAVLAPTGVAALNVAGETIHSFFKFLPNITLEEAAKKAKSQKKNALYKNLVSIIIDEVSMVRADLMDCIDVFLRTVKETQKPFGGVQMIFIGDLYQLPPVVTKQDRPHFENVYKSPWFFDANVFHDNELHITFVELEKIYRQKDGNFIDLLNSIRTNTVAENQIRAINKRVVSDEKSDAICLTSTNDRAATINEARLQALKSKLHTYEGRFDGSFDMRQLPTEKNLHLKEGAQVMFMNNDSAGRWVNGTIGHIKNIDEEAITVRIQDGEVVEVTQHTWDVSKYFYNAESKTLGQETLGSFTQIPLRLAWAITIHKSQGKTFDKVTIDLDRGSFASGQTYVALSRCRTFQGITLKKPIKSSDIRLDWRVQHFLTQHQYDISEKALPLEQKVSQLRDAIDAECEIEIVYLKAQDIKSRRKIRPQYVGEMDYEGKAFLGLEAWCNLRNETRTFRVDRILEIKK